MKPGLNGNRTHWIAIAALLLVTGAVYWPVRQHGFINFDDPDYVSANARVQAGPTADSLRWAFTESHSSNWHPLTWISHMLDCQLFGLKPGAHHLVNLAFHVANSLLLLWLLFRLTGAWWRSWVVAALFALHPLHVESVAWIAERKDVLSAFFGLLTLLAYTAYARSKAEGRRSKVWYGLALLSFALGLMSKPMLVTWPFVLLLLDVWPLNRMSMGERRRSKAGTKTPSNAGELPSTFDLRPSTLRPLLLEKLPFLALTVATAVITSVVQRGSGATVPLSVLPMEVRSAHLVVSYAGYLRKTFWPDDLAVFYPYVITPWDSLALWLALGLLVAISWAVVRHVRTQPAGLIGWCWFLGTFVPVIGLVQVGRQGMADRYTYIPHIGLFVALVWGLAAGFARWGWPRSRQLAVGFVAVAVCAVLTARQVRYWRDTATLAAHTVTVTRGNFIAHTQYATALLDQGKTTEALGECEKALQIMPDYAEAFNTRGAAYLRLGDLAAARTNFLNAARFDPRFPDPHHALADLAVRGGQFAEAETHSRAALAIAPMHLGARYTLAQALQGQGKLAEAVVEYQQLDRLKPGLFQVHRGLATVYVLQGNSAAALRELRQALQIVPNHPDTMNALATAMLDQGDVSGASNQFSAVLTLQPTNGIANFKIAQLLTAANRGREAIPHYRAALAAWPDSVEALNNLAWLLATSGDATLRDGAQAVRLATRATELTGNREALMLGTLAAACAEAGNFAEAVAAAEQAITLARAANQPALVQRNEELLQLYRAGKPYHEPP